MARVLRREPAEIPMDYVNLPDTSARRHTETEESGAAPGRNLYRLVAVSFGILCILQVALNVSLRLSLYSPGNQRVIDNIILTNVTQDSRQLRQLTVDQYLQQGWLHLRRSLYYISSIRKSWQESRDFCRQKGADLVIINTKEEQDFTAQFHRLTWIGLRYSGVEWKWRWVDGTPLTESYWGPNEPNGYEGKTEECVELRLYDNKNRWNDIPCADQNFWICEKSVAL
ncbi:C-type lectin domain family 17, member A-like [Cololabis saira]|uniref:C-type lectin domain family 17, member A-like n=1 Tax=Cololabis saira TaxID=129043 RepID=UPI002AD2E362|nr:C-type lectin domain family 17, member A-like [Cololabis saira]